MHRVTQLAENSLQSIGEDENGDVGGGGGGYPHGNGHFLEVAEEERKVGDESLSGTSDWNHTLHVTFNHQWARFEGLPPDWVHMNKQFGVPLKDVPKSILEGYEERIPSVLEMMKRELLANGGREVEGIFRLAPDKDDCAFVKKQINEGEFNGGCDVNVLANLIKVHLTPPSSSHI